MKKLASIIRSASALVVFAGLATAAQAEEFRVLNWQGYGTDTKAAIALFKEKTGLDVVQDSFNSEQEMLTKLRTNPGAYDVVLVAAPFVAAAAQESLLEPLDPASFTNYGDIVKSMAESDQIHVDGKMYGLPFAWGFIPLGYNTDKTKPAPTSIQSLWDPAFAGRVGLRDDGVEAVQLAAIATGQDINKPSDLDAIKTKLLALKSQVRLFWSSEDDWLKYFSSGQFDVATVWAGTSNRAKAKHNLPVGMFVPTEGALAYFDTLAVPAGAPHKEAALKFLDMMVSAELYPAWNAEAGASLSANPKAMQTLEDGAFNKTIAAQPDLIARLKWMGPISDDDRQTYLDLWTDVKTSFAQ